jgi:adenosylmethionine-8-amino-7-oxononanoate aminotransferase
MKAIKYPQGSVFQRRISHPHPVISHGEGVYLYDTQGRRYLDASGGAIVSNLGHGVRQVVDAIAEQGAKFAYAHPTQFTSGTLEAYAEALAKVTPLPNPKFYPLCSGSEAIETAIKFARQVQVERGESSRYLTIARQQSYHGTTLGALSVTGKPKMREYFKPMLVDMPHIPPPYCYRCPFDLAHPECDLRCAEALEQEIIRVGDGNVAAFLGEPVSGATLGAVVPPDGYWSRIREICDRHGLLLIADEVMSGMGRTGKWFAVDHWGLVPDIITMGKGTAGGYFPLAITAVMGEWVDMIVDQGHDFVHGGTFSHHAVGAAAGLATLKYLQQHDLVASVRRMGETLGNKLCAAFDSNPWVGDIRGKGFMWGLEFVADRDTRTPFPYQERFAQKVADAAFSLGLLVYPGSGCADGTSGDLVTLGPPFTITEEQLDELVGLLRAAVDEVGESTF